MNGAPPLVISLAVAALIGFLPGDGQGQQVLTGEVADTETGQELGSAIVILLDEAGQEVGRTLSAFDGGYRIEVPEAGRWAVEARMLGYRTERSEEIRVDGAPEEVNLALTPEAIELDPVEVRAAADRACEPLGETEGLLLAELWSEARKALDVIAVAERAEDYRFRLEERERAVDIFTGDIADERRTVRTLSEPFQSVPADELIDQGWVQPVPGQRQTFDYYAPDAELVLSREFEQRHCFGIREDEEDPDRVGISFEPVRDDGPPGIEGVFWLARDDGAPLELKFNYTDHLHRPAIPESFQPYFGGEVTFAQLDDGLWVVEDWILRLPQYHEGFSGGTDLPGTLPPLIMPFRRADSEVSERWLEIAWATGFAVREEGGSLLEVERR